MIEKKISPLKSDWYTHEFDLFSREYTSQNKNSSRSFYTKVIMGSYSTDFADKVE